MGQHINQIYDYHKWSNTKLFNHLKTLPSGTIQQEIKSVFPSIAKVLSHMCIADNVWLLVMEGKTYEEIKEITGQHKKESELSLEQLEDMFQLVSKQISTFLNNQEDVNKEIVCHHPAFGELKTTFAELIQHVVNHGTLHRGNISAMLRQMGYQGVSTDYIFYLYEKQQST